MNNLWINIQSHAHGGTTTKNLSLASCRNSCVYVPVLNFARDLNFADTSKNTWRKLLMNEPIYSKWWISMTWTMAKPQPLSVCISVYIWQKAQFCPNLKTQSLLMNLLVFQINIRIKINIGLRQLKSWFLDVFGLSHQNVWQTFHNKTVSVRGT